MRAALLLAIWPTLAESQDSTRFAWGAPVEGSAPSLLSLERCDLPCLAVVRFDNTLVTHGMDDGLGTSVLVRTTLVSLGVAVTVTVEAGSGMTPDLLRVLPPPGTTAEPGEMLVDDNDSGLVRVLLAPLS